MIYHITTKSEYASQQGKEFYSALSLEKEGFIYCATKEQVIPVLNRRFIGNNEVIVVEIDESKLKSELKFEDLHNKGEKHPHIYGKVNREAIVRLVDINVGEDGRYIQFID